MVEKDVVLAEEFQVGLVKLVQSRLILKVGGQERRRRDGRKGARNDGSGSLGFVGLEAFCHNN